MFRRITELLEMIERHLANIDTTLRTKAETIMSSLDDLQAQVAQNTSAEASAVTLINGLAQKLEDALNSGANSAQQSEQIAAIAAELRASVSPLAAAITANTTGAPGPVANQPGVGGGTQAPIVGSAVPGISPAPSGVGPGSPAVPVSPTGQSDANTGDVTATSPGGGTVNVDPVTGASPSNPSGAPLSPNDPALASRTRRG